MLQKKFRIYECTDCEAVVDSLQDIRNHIEDDHGNFNCRRCGQLLNIRQLQQHELHHVQDDVRNGFLTTPDVTVECCYCGLSRDETGFHYCDKNFLYSRYKIHDIRKPVGKESFEKEIYKIVNPYTIKTIVTKNNVVLGGQTVKSVTESTYSVPDEKYISGNIITAKEQYNKLRKMKKHIFNPKVRTARRDYDSDG